MTSRLMTMFGVTMLGTASLFAQAGPLSGEAKISLAPKVSLIAANTSFSVPLRIDVSGIKGRSALGQSTDAALGGYQIEVSFDNALLRLEKVSGGSTEGFTTAPTTTKLDQANATGRVMIVAARAGSGMSGDADVATLEFTAMKSGTAILKATPASVATAYRDGAGPASMAAAGNSATLTIEGAVHRRSVRR